VIPVLGSQPAGDVTHKPGGRQPILSAFQGVNSLPKTVTRQRRGCDLNPGPSAPESSTLTTRLPSHQREEYNKFDGVRLSLRPFVSLSISPPPISSTFIFLHLSVSDHNSSRLGLKIKFTGHGQCQGQEWGLGRMVTWSVGDKEQFFGSQPFQSVA